MKTKIFKTVAIVLLLTGCFSSCEKRGESSSQGIYYIVGYDGAAEVNDQAGTAKSGGYLFISENLKDSLLVNNRYENKGEGNSYLLGDLLDGIIDIPVEAFSGGGVGLRTFQKSIDLYLK